MTEIIRIPNIQKYTFEIINGDLILRLKENFIEEEPFNEEEKYIEEEEFNRCGLNSSKILNCIIKNGEEIISSNKLKYILILKDIYKSMALNKILQNTNFNIKLSNENNVKGYQWHPELKMSIQGKDARNTMNEILNMVKLNNYSIIISIKLETNEIINYKYNF